jgi:hypothetical protein
VRRDEFEAALDHMAERGVPLKADREAAWRSFAGWRVNYDTVLIALARITMAPRAPWSSDRYTPRGKLDLSIINIGRPKPEPEKERDVH